MARNTNRNLLKKALKPQWNFRQKDFNGGGAGI